MLHGKGDCRSQSPLSFCSSVSTANIVILEINYFPLKNSFDKVFLCIYANTALLCAIASTFLDKFFLLLGEWIGLFDQPV